MQFDDPNKIKHFAKYIIYRNKETIVIKIIDLEFVKLKN